MNNIYLNNNNYLIVQSNEYAIISCRMIFQSVIYLYNFVNMTNYI